MQFQPVDARAGAGNGLIKIVRGSKLVTIENGAKNEAELEAGLQLTGVYTGSMPNKFNPERVDYNLRADDGTLIILAQTASLKSQFSKVSVGELIQVTYNGKRSITRKNGSKADMHDYSVGRAIDAE